METSKPRDDGESHDHPTAADFRFDEARHTGVFTCSHVWKGAEAIVLVAHDGDGDWQFLCGAEHSEAADGECLLVCLEHIVSRDPSVNEVAAMCTAHSATREGPGAPWTIEDRTLNEIRSVIDEYGWWVGLLPLEGDAPAFAYTIGLYEKFGHPEIIVFGLAHESMHGILNHCGQRIHDGARFAAGQRIPDVLEGYDVQFRVVTANESYAEYLGCGCRHYGDRAFPVLQLVWPDKEHHFPGDEGAPDFLAKLQPLLA